MKSAEENRDAQIQTAWAGARLNWVMQLLIHLGEIKLSSNNTPEYLNDLPSLSIHQIVFWDETHKEQIVGFQGNKSYHFPCDRSRKYDANGTIQSEVGCRLHMKYPGKHVSAWALHLSC